MNQITMDKQPQEPVMCWWTKPKLGRKKKKETPIDELCKDQPDEFREFMHYCRGLSFTQDPDYDYIIKLFEGGMEGAVKSIDLAFEQAQRGTRTTKRTDDGRTIYTVDLGKRVGFIGGREGNARRRPMARRVRLVMEGNRLITAFPL